MFKETNTNPTNNESFRDSTSTLNTNQPKDPVIQPPMLSHHSRMIKRWPNRFIRVSEEFDINESDLAIYDEVLSNFDYESW